MAEEVGQEARAAGDWVVMGCPNVVRGGSHLGWASAARMAEAGICSVLSSDYFYPAMLRAALILADRGVLDLPRAWALISANPAAAAGLTDRGAIAEGLRADLRAGRSRPFHASSRPSPAAASPISPRKVLRVCRPPWQRDCIVIATITLAQRIEHSGIAYVIYATVI